MPGSGTPTSILGLNQYTGGDDWDFNDVNGDNTKIDRLPPTVCTSGTRPNTDLFVGRFIWETDTKRLLMWNGSSWILQTDDTVGAWTSFTPNVYTAMSTTPATVSRTVTLAKYKVIGKMCFAYADCTVNATTSGGCGIDLPFTAKDRNFISGSMWLMGATTPADQIGIAYMNGDKTKLVVVAATNGFRDNSATGMTLRYNVFYELP